MLNWVTTTNLMVGWMGRTLINYSICFETHSLLTQGHPKISLETLDTQKMCGKSIMNHVEHPGVTSKFLCIRVPSNNGWWLMEVGTIPTGWSWWFSFQHMSIECGLITSHPHGKVLACPWHHVHSPSQIWTGKTSSSAKNYASPKFAMSITGTNETNLQNLYGRAFM